MKVTPYGATGEVTGSCYLIQCGEKKLLLECGLVQGSREAEARNWEDFPIAVEDIDAVILSHAHIDHSGRLPLLVKRGYRGPIYTHNATKALCDIMLQDSAYLNEKDVEWENKRRLKSGKELLHPLYNRKDAMDAIEYFEGTSYDVIEEIFPGIKLRFSDAGHILGSAIVELWHDNHGKVSKLAFSGDLGYAAAPVMEDPTAIAEADLVLLESTYGGRLHREYAATLEEIKTVFETALTRGGNILIPAFAVGRTQDLLYLLSEHYDEWGLANWTVFLDSPMAINATEVYAHFQNLYEAKLFNRAEVPMLPNLVLTRSSEESMAINRIRSGAIIIAGSGMCSGGRIRHHLKMNISRSETHLMIIGFQAYGTLGRKLVDGADSIRLWGEEFPVRASVHTIGGLSAHADQAGLLKWYGNFKKRPPVLLVHGETEAQTLLQKALREQYGVDAKIAECGVAIDV